MALQKGFTDRSNVEHPRAYWRLVSINVDIDAQAVRSLFACYHDAESRAINAARLPDAVLVVTSGAADYAKAFDAACGKDAKGLAAFMYDKAKEVPALAGATDC